jgi:hypothetical protein
MSEQSNPQPVDATDARLSVLRAKVGWLCQLIRVAAATYAGWIIIWLVTGWSDEPQIIENYSRFLHADLSGMAGWQRGLAFGIHFAIWLIITAACVSIWRLFTSYLSGQIFTVGAALWLRRAALFGAIAELTDIATRPVISMILTAHLESGHRVVKFFFLPNDLLNLLFLGSLLALAQVFKVAAEIADEQRQFV